MRRETLPSLFGLVALAALISLVSCTSSDDEPGSSSGGGGGTSGAGGSGATDGGTPTGTCKDVCGAQADDGSCYCDGACEANGDCCSDFVAECKNKQVTMPAGCVSNANFFALCNPVSNEGCTGAGAACDWGGGGVKCYAAGNTEAAGAPCGGDTQKYCIPTYTCDGSTQTTTGICRKYCCSDADCGGGSCKPFDTAKIGSLGACQAGGGTDAGTDAATD